MSPSCGGEERWPAARSSGGATSASVALIVFWTASDIIVRLIQINSRPCAICQSRMKQERERQVTTNQAYYVVLVCGAFLVFAVSMALAYVRYRRSIRQQPGAAD